MGTISEEIEKREKELEGLKECLNRFPDLEWDIDRWSNKRLSSPSINKQATDVEFNHNCSCCADSPFQAWPHQVYKGVKIYSKPACFIIGEKNQYGIGDTPYTDWQEKLKENNINNIVIERIEEYFKENPPIDYDNDEPYDVDDIYDDDLDRFGD